MWASQSRRLCAASVARRRALSVRGSANRHHLNPQSRWPPHPALNSTVRLLSVSPSKLPPSERALRSDNLGPSQRREQEEATWNNGRGPIKLTPDVPPGARVVQLRGTNRRNAVIRYLRQTSIDVNYDYRAWAKHQGPWRNLAVWSPREVWRNSDMRRILFPDVLQVGFVAAALTYYNQLCAHEVWLALDTDGDGDVSVAELTEGINSGLVEAHHIMGTDFFITNDMIMMGTTIPFSLTSMALGMMMAFRTQNCNARYNEARATWGSMVNEGRALSSRILSLVGSKHPADSEVQVAANHMVKCIMTFSHALKYHITTDGQSPDLNIFLGMTDAEVNRAKGDALRQELSTVWDYDDPVEVAYVNRMLSTKVASRPLHVLQEMSELTAHVFLKPAEEGGAGLSPQQIQSMYRSITRLQTVLGVCERLYKTPIYTGASRFTSRCVVLWTNFIPLALYPIMGPVATVPGSVVVAIFMYGLEDVGARIEQPFGSLPLWQYVEGIDASCRQTLEQHQVLRDIPR